jgi:hypothetical protein
MSPNQQVVTILGTALTTSTSFNVLIITFLLGEYATLDRENRTSREKKPYYYSTLLLFGVLWIGGISLLLLLSSVHYNSNCLLSMSIGLFVLQIISLILGLSWVGYKTLFD